MTSAVEGAPSYSSTITGVNAIGYGRRTVGISDGICMDGVNARVAVFRGSIRLSIALITDDDGGLDGVEYPRTCSRWARA